MAKSTPFDRLQTWLPPRRLAAWMHISLPDAAIFIAAAPPRQRRGCMVSKYRFQPDAENCRHLIQQLLQDKTFRHRALLLKKVRRLMKAHGGVS